MPSKNSPNTRTGKTIYTEKLLLMNMTVISSMKLGEDLYKDLTVTLNTKSYLTYMLNLLMIYNTVILKITLNSVSLLLLMVLYVSVT